MLLQDKVAIITGAGSGQGEATANLFAKEGAKVVVADWNEKASQHVAEKIIDQGGDALFIKVDISNEDEVRSMVEMAMNKYNRIDILFNNAGIGYSSSARFKMAPLVETPLKDWNAILSINLTGAYLASKYVLPIMSNQKSGNIINNSSLAGIKGGEQVSAYTVSKAGVVALTRIIASEYGEHNIRANCICPGVIDTPMMADHLAPFQQSETRLWPLGRIGTPKDVANAALFLASESSSYITGLIMPVDGGWNIK